MTSDVERILKINSEITAPLLGHTDLALNGEGTMMRYAIHFFYQHVLPAKESGAEFVLEDKDKRTILLSMEKLFLIKKEQVSESKQSLEIVLTLQDRKEFEKVIASSREYNPEKPVEQIAEQLLRTYVAICVHLVHGWSLFRTTKGGNNQTKINDIDMWLKSPQEPKKKILDNSWSSAIMQERGEQ